MVALDLGWFEVDEDPQLDRGGPVGWAQRRGLFKVVLLAQLVLKDPCSTGFGMKSGSRVRQTHEAGIRTLEA